MEIKEINSNLIPLDASYLGNNVFKSNSHSTFTGYDINLKNVFKNPIGYSIGRDTFLALTDYKYYDDMFLDIRNSNPSISGLLNVYGINDFSSYLSLSAIGEDGVEGGVAIEGGKILGFSLIDETILRETVDYSFNSSVSFDNVYWVYNNGILDSEQDPNVLTEDHYFYFLFIDPSKCNIVKSVEGGEMYLTYDKSTSELKFLDLNGLENFDSQFFYSYNSNENKIVLTTSDGMIGLDPDSGDISVISISSSELSSEVPTTILTVDYKNNLNKSGGESIQNSFLASYSNKNGINSQYPVDNNHIVSHLYDSELVGNSNLITLKNNTTADGEYSLINVNNTSTHRNYTSLNTGIRGDTGFSNIIPTYNTNMFKVDFTPDKRTFFNVPYELEGYSKININDCNLINNGSIGGSSPLNSDKIYKKLYEYSQFRNTGQIDNTPNGQYLCSWLWYNPIQPSQSIWLDRYYNPDRVAQLNALSVDSWNAISDITSYLDTSDLTQIYGDYINEFDKDIGVFDVVSQLTIQPDALYVYERIGKSTSSKLNDELLSSEILSIDETKFDFETSIQVSPNDTANDQEFSISIVLEDFNINTFKGNRIFGNNTISLTIDRYYSPYTAAVSDNSLYFYDHTYNLITSVDFDVNINDVIFTDNYNIIYVELINGELLTIENLDFITNSTGALSSYDINHITYSNNLLYFITTQDIYFSFNPNSEEITPIDSGNSGDDLLLVYNNNFSSYKGEYIDYSNDGSAYILSSNGIMRDDISTPIITGDIIRDIAVDSNNIIYVLKDDSLFKIDNTFFSEVLTSVDITPEYTLEKIIMGRYIRNGQITEYIDVIDPSYSGYTKIRRYDKSLNLLDTYVVNPAVGATFIKDNNTYSTKYLEKKIEIDITLFNIFNYNNVGNVRMEVPLSFIEEDDTCIINASFSNNYGSINIYCNGKLIDIYKFDPNTYYFSNTLRDTKIFLGASNFNPESTISESIESSNFDMISGNYKIKEFKLYDTSLSFFDIININRIYRDTDSCSLILPIKSRSYIDEISGMNIQTKNLRKSEYGSVTLKGSKLTEPQKVDVKDKIDKIFEDTFINLRVSETKIL